MDERVSKIWTCVYSLFLGPGLFLILCTVFGSHGRTICGGFARQWAIRRHFHVPVFVSAHTDISFALKHFPLCQCHAISWDGRRQVASLRLRESTAEFGCVGDH